MPEGLLGALRAARHVAVLTGAGVSAESGIPTFRDAMTGLWARYSPMDLATPKAFASRPGLVWDWYAWRRELVGRAVPNPAHHALARLQSLVERVTLVTQNVDGLHQLAGSAPVLELHGNLLRSRCERDGATFTSWDEGRKGEPPRCPACGGFLRPDVVWFGEALPADVLDAAFAAAEACDVFLSVGTSNLVEPAASIPWVAAAGGTPVGIVNISTERQRAGPRTYHLVGRAGDVLPMLLERVWGANGPAPC